MQYCVLFLLMFSGHLVGTNSLPTMWYCIFISFLPFPYYVTSMFRSDYQVSDYQHLTVLTNFRAV